MNLRFLTGFAALGCVLFASCTPYNEQQNKKPTRKPAQKAATTAEQQKIQEQRDLMQQKEEEGGGSSLSSPPTGRAMTPSSPTEPAHVILAVRCSATASTWGELGRVVEAACEVREKMMIQGPS